MAIEVNNFFPGQMSPTTTVGGCIDIFENAWPNPKETISMVENAVLSKEDPLMWTRATTIGQGVNQDKRTNYHLGLTSSAKNDSVVAQNVHNQMYLLSLASSIPYAKKHNVEELFHEEYNMLKYSTGQEYKAHYDGTTAMGRSISAIVYLNDDYEGGEVEFVNFGIKIKPQPGMLLLFPSTYPYAHIAHPVTSGVKYAIVTWIHDRPL